MLEFQVECNTTPGQHVAVCGGGALGEWDPEKSVILKPTRYPVWTGKVSFDKSGPIEFKYILVELPGSTPRLIRWECDGANRQANPQVGAKEKVVFHHVFGNTGGEKLEVVKVSGSSSTSDTRPPARESAGTEVSSAVDISSNKSSVLQSLQVGASLRFGRIITTPDAFPEKYELREDAVLGTGMSGGVVIAMDRKTSTKVAVKTLNTEGLDGAALAQVIAEVQNQLTMDHPNICRLLEVFEEPDCLRLVMERMRGPDLFVHLSRKGKYTERDAAGCVRQMCSAVAYCHRRGVCHRDLKLDNFCLEDNSSDARVKLIDFGLSSAFTTNVPMTNACGTLYYVAPEVLSGAYDKKCDMWSLGVITYILLDGRAPFMGRDDRATFMLIRRGTYSFPQDRWGHLSQEAKDFVSSLLQVDVPKRLDAEAALVHPWVTTFIEKTESGSESLDINVLQGMQRFTQSNALKRAVMRAVAPIATPDQVALWADQFEALDTQNTGEVLVTDLAKALVASAQMTEADAQQLSATLAGVEGETVSYSAFLAACLSAHATIGEAELRELFDRLDKSSDGRVSVDEVSLALGDVVDAEALAADFGESGLTFDDFRWIMSMPRLGPTKLGLKNLLSTYNRLDACWKSTTKQAKRMSAAAAAEASRRENMAWRVWNQKIARGEVPDEPVVTASRPQCALSLESLLVGRFYKREVISQMSRQEKREVIINDLLNKGQGTREDYLLMSDEELAMAAAPRAVVNHNLQPASAVDGDADKLERTATYLLVTEVLDGDVEKNQAEWSVATAEAKDGSVEAARRENMHWRKMHLTKKIQEETGTIPELGEPDRETILTSVGLSKLATKK